MNYRREIDGLRALAVLPVILFHGGIEAFGGGYVGVDIFFVISGYLITSILLDAKESGTFSLAAFYERRIRRILPALFFVMAVCVPLAWFWLLPNDMRGFSRSLIAVSLFSSNFLFWKESGYFDTSAEFKPLLHTWSLGVEEQYYLLFPLFLALAWRFGKRGVAVSLVVVGILSLAIAQWGAHNAPPAAFFLLSSRAWELVLGALCALHVRKGRGNDTAGAGNQWAGFVGLIFIALSVFLFTEDTPFPGLYALFPTVGAALIILFAKRETYVGKVLGSRIFVGIGLISYSAYLWHQPLFAFARHLSVTEPPVHQMLLLCALSLVLAYFSWRFVEQPVRSSKTLGRRTVFISAAALTSGFILLGAAGVATKGFEKYFYEHRSQSFGSQQLQLAAAQTNYDVEHYMAQDGQCRIWARKLNPKLVANIESCAERYKKAVVVLGDSHAMNLFNVLSKSDVYPFIVGISQGYCRLSGASKATCSYEEFEQFLQSHGDKVQVVVYHQTGHYLLVDEKGSFKGKHKYEGGTPLKVDYDALEKIKHYLEKIGAFTKVVWVGPWAEPQINEKHFHRYAAISDGSVRGFGLLDVGIKESLSNAKVRFKYYSLIDELESDGYHLWSGDCLKFRDEDHLSKCGENLVAHKHKAFWKMILTENGIAQVSEP